MANWTVPAKRKIQFSGTGILTNLLEQLLDFLLCPQRPVDKLVQLGAIFDPPRQHPQLRLATGERISTLVSQTGHGFADRGKTFRLKQLLLGHLAIRYILHRSQDAHRFASCIAG